MKTILDYFIESGKPKAKYKGETIFVSYSIPIKKSQNLILRWHETNSKFIQGISLHSDRGIIILGIKSKGIILWEDTSDPIVNIICNTRNGFIHIHNKWKEENGEVQSGTSWSAMKVKQDKNKYTFYCNDGQPNDDFTDLIFSIELLGDDER